MRAIQTNTSNKEVTEFARWLDTFISEKGLDMDTLFYVDEKFGISNVIPFTALIENIKGGSPQLQAQIKITLVKIDYVNGNVMDVFKHLAQGIKQ